jgi:peptide deformylase
VCLSFPGVYYDVKRRLNTVVRGFTDRGDPVQVVGTEVLTRCLQYETGHLDGVLFIDRDGRRDEETGYEGNQSIKVGCADEDGQVSEDWPHTLTSGAGDRAPV